MPILKKKNLLKKYLIPFLLLFLSIHLFAQEWNIKFYHEVVGREAVIFADNDEWSPISSQFDFELNNMKSSLSTGSVVVIPPKTTRYEISRLAPLKPNTSNSFKYDMIYNMGNVLLEEYDKNYIYDLPFANGKTYRVDQGYNGIFSHQGADALDFSLQIGEEVRAARGGIVVEAVSHNTKACPNISCAKFNNKVLVMHSDGTFADYSHLQQNGVVVRKGDQVSKGQLLGYSGDTGFASGPHLHFSVFINRLDGSRTYIKTKFNTTASSPELLQQGKSYTKK